jgi:hypothetical protein
MTDGNFILNLFQYLTTVKGFTILLSGDEMNYKYFILLISAVCLFFFAGNTFAQKNSSLKKETIKGVVMVSIPAGSFMMGHEYVNAAGKSDKAV